MTAGIPSSSEAAPGALAEGLRLFFFLFFFVSPGEGLASPGEGLEAFTV